MESATEVLRTIFHEYVHLVIDNVSDGMPLWLNEGLAEYYSTFLVDGGHGRAHRSGRFRRTCDLLSHRRQLSIPELLAVDGESPPTTRVSARHSSTRSPGRSCTCSSPAGESRHRSVGVTGDSSPGALHPSTAWQQVFKDAHIIRQLQRYVGRESMRGVLYRFNQNIPTVKSYSSRVSEGDVQAVLGDLLRRVAEAKRRPPGSRKRSRSDPYRRGCSRSMACSGSTRTKPTRRCPC